MSHARKKKRYPYYFYCSQCTTVEMLYAFSDQHADIKIGGRGWKRDPDRCLRCVAAADQKRTGVLESRA